MKERRVINDHIRRHLRRLRKSQGLTALELAQQMGLPRTSYVSLETGAYQLKLDLLHRALAVLGAQIEDVWPSYVDSEEALLNQGQLLKAQQFRLREMVDVCGARGGILLSKNAGAVSIHLASGMSEIMTDRILFYLEDERLFRPGMWFKRLAGATTFHLYLQTEQVPKPTVFLIEHYLVIWSTFFGSSVPAQAPDQS